MSRFASHASASADDDMDMRYADWPAGAHVHHVDSWELEPLHADAVGWQPRTMQILHASVYECISIRSHCTVVLLTLCCSMMAVLIPE